MGEVNQSRGGFGLMPLRTFDDADRRVRFIGRASAPLLVFRRNTGLILCYVLMPLRALDDSDEQTQQEAQQGQEVRS